jgi:hypothetical protein
VATHSHERTSDLGAALTGLFVGATVVFIILFAIVQLTNRKFAGHAEPQAPAGQTAPGH